MNAKQQKEYWNKVERLRKGLDDKYTKLFAEAIKKDLEQFIVDIRKFGLQGSLSYMGAYAWNESMMTLMNKLYKESAILFGNAVFRAIGVMNKKSIGSDNEKWVKDIVEFMVKFGISLVSQMTQTTKAKLQEIVSRGILEGKSVDDIVKEIMSDEETGYSLMRAKRIVRTEVMRSSNYVAMMAADAHDFYVDKIWISSHDNRTRRIPRDMYDHWDMNGKVVHWEEDFVSLGKKGDTVLAGYPGDPTAPKGFTINCRCTVGFIGRRDENGRLIRKQG